MRGRGRIGEALTLFQETMRLNSRNPLNLKQVGRCLFLLGKHKSALEVYDEAQKVRVEHQMTTNTCACARRAGRGVGAPRLGRLIILERIMVSQMIQRPTSPPHVHCYVFLWYGSYNVNPFEARVTLVPIKNIKK